MEPRHQPQTICKIDGSVFYTERQLLFHLKSLGVSYKDYYDQFLRELGEGKCAVCGNETRYYNLRHGYARFCSHACSVIDPTVAEKRSKSVRQALLNKYGVSNPSQLPTWKEKVQTTNMKKYGVKYYVNPEKAKKTQLERYGDYYVNTPEYKNSVKMQSFTKYGVEHFTQAPEIKERAIKTNLQKYGVPHVLSIVASKKLSLRHKIEKHYKFIKEYAESQQLHVDLPSPEEFFQNSSSRIYPTTCLQCKDVFTVNWSSSHKKVTCKRCNKPHYVSKWEREVLLYLETLVTEPMVLNHREYEKNVLYELDIYIPSLKIGIECNGVYWHGERNGKKEKSYHLNKTNYYESRGIRVIQIWDNEWATKKDIVQSRLQNILNKTDIRLFARKLTTTLVSAKDARNFFEQNHLGGFLRAKYHIGLTDTHGTLVAAMSVSPKGRLGISANKVELLRFASKLNHTIVGGFSKLLKYLVHEVAPELRGKEIVSYADRRWSWAINCGYTRAGFKFVRTTEPSYWYVKSGKMFHRTLFMKHLLPTKLKKFNPEFTEFENMILNGYDRVWDCGELVYVYDCK